MKPNLFYSLFVCIAVNTAVFAQTTCFERVTFETPLEDDRSPLSMSFVNDTLGYAVFHVRVHSENYWKLILVKTTDGGKTWEQINLLSLPNSSIFSEVKLVFTDENTGHLFTKYGSIRTKDGGQTWERYGAVNPNVVTLDFNKRIIVTYQAAFVDRSISWVLWIYDAKNKIGNSVRFPGYISLDGASVVNDSTWVAVGLDTITPRYHGTIQLYLVRRIISKSTDTGRTWKAVHIDTIGRAAKSQLLGMSRNKTPLFFTSANEGVLVRNGGIYKTTDGFQTYQSIAKPDGAVEFIRAQQITEDTLLVMYATDRHEHGGAKIYKTSLKFDHYTELDLDSLTRDVLFHFFKNGHGIIHGINSINTRTPRLPLMHTTLDCKQAAFSSQPKSQTVAENSPLRLSAKANKNVGYQWYCNDVELQDEFQSELIINNMTPSHAGAYHCLITDMYTMLSSDTALISVKSVIVEKQPQPQTICENDTAIFSISATNATTYQWYKNNTPIVGATDPIYQLFPMTAQDTGSYHCKAKNTSDSAISDDARLHIKFKPTIVQQPKDTTVYIGQSATLFFVSLDSDISAQWMHNNTAIDGATESYLYIENTILSDTGVYLCEITNECGTTICDTIRLFVKEIKQIEITGKSNDTTVCANTAITLFVNAKNAKNYQWYKNDTLIASATFPEMNVSPAAHAVYACKISNEMDSATTYIEIDVWPSVEIIEHSPATLSAMENDTIQLFVRAKHAEKYEWFPKGQPVETHPKSEESILQLNNLKLEQSGKYICRVHGQCSYSDIKFTLTVVADTTPNDTTPNPPPPCDTCTTKLLLEQAENTIVYYPNPTTGIIHIRSEKPISLLQIFNTSGQMVYKQERMFKENVIDISSIPSGTYIIRIKIGDSIATGTIVKT